MNEQLQAALAKIMEQLSSGALTAASKLPEAFTQYVAYTRASSVMWMCVFGVATILFLVAIVVSKRLAPGGFGDDSAIGRFIYFVLAIGCLCAVAYNCDTYIATSFPQAMALDMVRELMKSGK